MPGTSTKFFLFFSPPSSVMSSSSLHYKQNSSYAVIILYMRNKMLERLNWKQCLQTLGNIYVKELVRVYADRRVDNTMDDTTEINLANKYATIDALVKHLHRQ